jgi:integrase/recombinase XerC
LNVIGKGRDSGELVKIARKTEMLINDWLQAREDVDIVTDSSPLFCSLGNNSFGEALSSNSVSTLCKRYLEAAELKTPQIVAHSLRHSLATNSLMKGASLMEVQQQLRHANLNTTQIYLHEAEKAANRCAELISDAIF